MAIEECRLRLRLTRCKSEHDGNVANWWDIKNEMVDSNVQDASMSALVNRLRDNCPRAQETFFCIYYRRLVRTLRAKLRGRLAYRVDPNDIALTTIRNFFLHAQRTSFPCTDDAQVWRLLLTIAENTLRSQSRYFTAKKRDIAREVKAIPHEVSGHLSNPADIAAVKDELNFVVSRLKAGQRDVGKRILAGESEGDIAKETERSVRSVRRIRSTIERETVARLAAVGR